MSKNGFDFLSSKDNNGDSYYADNGDWGYKNDDGSGSFYGKDGSWGYVDADGNGSYYGKDGSWGYINPDGSGSYFGKNTCETNYSYTNFETNNDSFNSYEEHSCNKGCSSNSKSTEEYFCPNCNAILNKQKGFDPSKGSWTCKSCGQHLMDESVFEGDKFKGVAWYCDKCGDLLNKQPGFSDSYGSWICAKCHYRNPIEEANIINNDFKSRSKTKEKNKKSLSFRNILHYLTLGIVPSDKQIEQRELEKKRIQTPCEFTKEFTQENFTDLAVLVAAPMTRLSIVVNCYLVKGTVRTVSGINTWSFILDFNDFGKITGNYWIKANENLESSIPNKYANMLKDAIENRLKQINK